jgi:hypothetical protein
MERAPPIPTPLSTERKEKKISGSPLFEKRKEHLFLTLRSICLEMCLSSCEGWKNRIVWICLRGERGSSSHLISAKAVVEMEVGNLPYQLRLELLLVGCHMEIQIPSKHLLGKEKTEKEREETDFDAHCIRQSLLSSEKLKFSRESTNPSLFLVSSQYPCLSHYLIRSFTREDHFDTHRLNLTAHQIPAILSEKI